MTLIHYVSSRYTADKLASQSIEDRIEVYEDRVEGWLLGPTRALLDVPHSQMAVLNLCLGYFEGWAYEQARCGVAHDGMPRKKVLIGSLPTPIAVAAQVETGELVRSSLIRGSSLSISSVTFVTTWLLCAIRPISN
jgi:hypothetical protein